MIRFAAAALFAAFAVSGASAEELRPMQATSIAFGEVTGVAYYTVAGEGYEVVATLAAGEGATPVRFITTLVAGQKMTVSVPGASTEEPMELEFARLGDTLYVSSPTETAMLN